MDRTIAYEMLVFARAYICVWIQRKGIMHVASSCILQENIFDV